MSKADHESHCFVALPTGKTDDERIEFAGWLKEVVEPAVRASDLEPKVAAASDEPTSITNDILEHLVFDPVAVFDLAGTVLGGDANPNVMYELGVRHAFKLPSVILGRKGQRLPFDVTDQRGILVDRRAYYFQENRQLIQRFVEKAKKGKSYNPLESLERIARLETAGDSGIEAIGKELAELRTAIVQLEKRHGVDASTLDARRAALMQLLGVTSLSPPATGRFTLNYDKAIEALLRAPQTSKLDDE